MKASHDCWVSHVLISCVFFLVGLLMTFELLMLSFVAHEFLVFQLATHDFWVAHVLFVTHDFFLAVHVFLGYSCFFAFNRLLMTFELLMILCGFLMYFLFNLHDLWVSDYFICCSWLFMFISFLKAAHQSLLSYSWLWIPWPGISAP